jgi:hypothetical protein
MSNPAEFILDIAFHARRQENLEQGSSAQEFSVDTQGYQVRSPTMGSSRSVAVLKANSTTASDMVRRPRLCVRSLHVVNCDRAVCMFDSRSDTRTLSRLPPSWHSSSSSQLCINPS